MTGVLQAESRPAGVVLAEKTQEVVQAFVKKYDGGRYHYICSGPLFNMAETTLNGVWVTAKTEETLQSGRQKAVAFLQSYFQELQTNKYAVASFEDHCKTLPNRFSGPFTLKNIGLRIDYWTAEVERPKSPCLAQIKFYENSFRYYEADPKTLKLKLVLEESYEKALSQLTPTLPE